MTLLLFDIDGTLTTDNTVATRAFKKSVKETFGISQYNENWYEYELDSDCGIIKTIISTHQHRNVGIEELLQFQECYLANFDSLLDVEEDSVYAVNGVNRFFDVLNSYNDIKIALFTGGFPKIAQRKLDIISIKKSLLLAAAFDGMSREEIFARCLTQAQSRYAQKFHQIILFGDSISDINISKTYNIPLVGITTQLSSETFMKAGIKIALPNYTDLKIKEILKDVNCRFE